MFRTLKYQSYVFISLSVFVLVLLLGTNLSFYFYTESIIGRNVVQNKLQTTQKLQEQLDALLGEMNTITISINASNYIQQILRNIPESGSENYFDQYPQIGREVRDVLYSITGLQPLKGSIMIFSRNFDYIDLSNKMDSQMVNKEYISNVPRVKFLLNGSRISMDHILLSPHSDDWSASGEPVFSLIRPIRDNFNVYGLIEISYRLEEISKLFAFHNRQTDSSFIIFDKNKNVFYNHLGDDLDLNVQGIFDEQITETAIGNYEVKGKENTYMATYAHLNNEDWIVLMLEDISSYKKPIVVLRNTSIIIYLITILTTLFILYIYTLGITRPIRQLKKSLMDVQVGDLQLLVYNANNNNEIVMLSKVVQDLFGEIRRHMDITSEAHRNEMSANMAALQAQINPHFLYNTLSVISAHGQKQGNREVVEMCNSLASMFRYVTQSEQSRTVIEHELEHIRNYFMLMAKRYEGLFRYEFDIDERITQVPVPKLLLQPFVENMFQHAFTNRKPPWNIQIVGRFEDQRWSIRFMDNGSGISPDALKQLRLRAQEIRESMTKGGGFIPGNSGIGMMNAYQRLHMTDPENAAFYCDNRPEGGAVIEIGGGVADV